LRRFLGKTLWRIPGKLCEGFLEKRLLRIKKKGTFDNQNAMVHHWSVVLTVLALASFTITATRFFFYLVELK